MMEEDMGRHENGDKDNGLIDRRRNCYKIEERRQERFGEERRMKQHLCEW